MQTTPIKSCIQGLAHAWRAVGAELAITGRSGSRVVSCTPSVAVYVIDPTGFDADCTFCSNAASR